MAPLEQQLLIERQQQQQTNERVRERVNESNKFKQYHNSRSHSIIYAYLRCVKRNGKSGIAENNDNHNSQSLSPLSLSFALPLFRWVRATGWHACQLRFKAVLFTIHFISIHFVLPLCSLNQFRFIDSVLLLRIWLCIANCGAEKNMSKMCKNNIKIAEEHNSNERKPKNERKLHH